MGGEGSISAMIASIKNNSRKGKRKAFDKDKKDYKKGDPIISKEFTTPEEKQQFLKELQVQGKDFMAEASESLDKTYHEKKEELESFTDICPEKIEELKANLFSIYEEIKKKIIS